MRIMDAGDIVDCKLPYRDEPIKVRLEFSTARGWFVTTLNPGIGWRRDHWSALLEWLS